MEFALRRANMFHRSTLLVSASSIIIGESSSWFLNLVLPFYVRLVHWSEKEKVVLGTFSVTMDGGADLPRQMLFFHTEMMPDSFDEFLNSATATCSHTHSCNPPRPSTAMHTHTCLRTHTQVIAGGEDDDDAREEESTKHRKPLGNREAVRKYREKKKAHAAFLEEEVRKLRATNQQLLRRLQSHAVLEAEVVMLRSLLLDVRDKIEAEVGGFSFPKQCSVGSVVSADPAPCFNGNSGVGEAWEYSSPSAAAADRDIYEGGGVSRETTLQRLCIP